MYVCIYIYIYRYTYMYIYIYIERERDITHTYISLSLYIYIYIFSCVPERAPKHSYEYYQLRMTLTLYVAVIFCKTSCVRNLIWGC